jgi:hypothetical protein
MSLHDVVDWVPKEGEGIKHLEDDFHNLNYKAG